MGRADLFVLGGGGLLQDKTSSRSLVYYLALIAAARLSLCEVVLYALGVESITNRFWCWALPFILAGRRVTLSVRDSESKEILESIGVKSKPIHVTGDPVFLHELKAPAAVVLPNRTPSALIIPRFPSAPGGRLLYRRIASVLSREYGLRVQWLLFQFPVEWKYISSLVPEESVLWFDIHSSKEALENLVQTVAQFDYVVSARFHGLVLASLAGRPFMGVGDVNKVGRLCHRMDMPFLDWGAGEREIQGQIAHLSTKFLHNAPLSAVKEAASQTIQLMR